MKCATAILILALAGPALQAQQPEGAAPPRIEPRGAGGEADPLAIKDWPQRIAAVDVGSKDEGWAQTDLDDRDWKTMKLPTHWESAGLPDYDGVVWFRREVQLTKEQATGEGLLSLGAIDDMDVTWVNGKRVGGFEAAGAHFTPRNYELPDGLLKEGRNVIAVRVMDHGYGGGLAQTHGRMALRTGGQRIPLTGAWRYRPGADLTMLIGSSDGHPAQPRPEPWTGDFALHENDVVAFAGGSGMAKQMEAGYLEALLTEATAKRVFFRDIAWQADTVYQQQRPRNFGTQLELLNRIHATVIVTNFGQMEALDGVTRLADFITAYERLLDQLAQRTPRIVLIPPHPFDLPARPHLPDLRIHNGDVAAYSEAIRQLAERRGYLFADASSFDPTGRTTDGIHLSPAGQREWAATVASQLLHRGMIYEAPRLDPLRRMIQRKNTLWRQHWRPTNWSFLYGNRQHVPSSHDHRPGQPRWFPIEVDGIIPLIEAEEGRINTLRKEAP